MQCSVYKNTGESESYAPYLLDVQAELLEGLETRVMVPLVRASEFGRRAGRLHPVFTVCGEEVVMATHLLAAIRSSILGRIADSLIKHRAEIIGALDVLLVGVYAVCRLHLIPGITGFGAVGGRKPPIKSRNGTSQGQNAILNSWNDATNCLDSVRRAVIGAKGQP